MAKGDEGDIGDAGGIDEGFAIVCTWQRAVGRKGEVCRRQLGVRRERRQKHGGIRLQLLARTQIAGGREMRCEYSDSEVAMKMQDQESHWPNSARELDGVSPPPAACHRFSSCKLETTICKLFFRKLSVNFSQPLASSANTSNTRRYPTCFTSAAIRSPHSRSVTARSYRDCRFIQNCELLPKKCANLNAVSGLIARLPLRIPVTRPDGTCRARASLLADNPRASNSRFRIRPG